MTSRFKHGWKDYFVLARDTLLFLVLLSAIFGTLAFYLAPSIERTVDAGHPRAGVAK